MLGVGGGGRGPGGKGRGGGREGEVKRGGWSSFPLTVVSRGEYWKFRRAPHDGEMKTLPHQRLQSGSSLWVLRYVLIIHNYKPTFRNWELSHK